MGPSLWCCTFLHCLLCWSIFKKGKHFWESNSCSTSPHFCLSCTIYISPSVLARVVFSFYRYYFLSFNSLPSSFSYVFPVHFVICSYMPDKNIPFSVPLPPSWTLRAMGEGPRLHLEVIFNNTCLLEQSRGSWRGWSRNYSARCRVLIACECGAFITMTNELTG